MIGKSAGAVPALPFLLLSFVISRMDVIAKALLLFPATFLLLGALFFVSAGTLDYWQAWLYLLVLFIPMLAVVAYFLVKDREFLARRFQAREREKEQKLIQLLGAPLFLAGFLLPGFDRRFGWSAVPIEAVLVADALVFIGYMAVFWVFRVNSYASRTIRVEKGQKVVSSGPYARVRHPMYSGVLLMFLATPIALGSYVALIPFVLYTPLLLMRIRNEEEVLGRELKGYKEYCRKVKWRLVMGVW